MNSAGKIWYVLPLSALSHATKCFAATILSMKILQFVSYLPPTRKDRSPFNLTNTVEKLHSVELNRLSPFDWSFSNNERSGTSSSDSNLK